MNRDVDQSTQRQVEEFHRQTEATERLWQAAVTELAADRLRRDVAALYEPPPPRRRMLARASSWLIRKLATRTHKKRRQTQNEQPTIIVIDSTSRIVSRTTASPFQQQKTKRQ